MKKKITLVMASVAGALGLVYMVMDGKRAPGGCKDVVVSCDTFSFAGWYGRHRFHAWECAGEVQHAQNEGGSVPRDHHFEILGQCVKEDSKSIPKKPELVNYVCVQQPVGGSKVDCMRLNKEGKFVDPGQGNAFPIGEAVGDGCEPRPCVEVAGIPFNK